MPQTPVQTVTEFTRHLKQTFEQSPGLRDVWLKGELSNVKEYSMGQQIYFTLKDDNAQISGVIFAQYKPAFSLQDNMQVIVRGKVTIYEKRGVYSLQAFYIEPAGIGALALAFEQLKKKLEAEGLFQSEQKKVLPRYPKVVGVLTSPTGAVWHDIVTTVRRRNPSLELILIPAVVQGYLP